MEVDLDFKWWSHSFKSAIRDFGRTVMVLAPWHDPVPLRRGWCLFEIYSTIVTQSSFEVAMTHSSRQEFLKDITSNARASIDNMLATIDVAKSECFKLADRERIFEIVQREVGVSQINSMIFERMRSWVIETTETASRDDPGNFGLIKSLATLNHNQGQYGKAEPLYVASLEHGRVVLGESHPDTLSSMNSLAGLYHSQGQYDKAEPLYVACLDQRRIIFGESHPDTLTSMNNLALLYKGQGQYDKAESILVDCLRKREVVLGLDHPDTIETRNQLNMRLRNKYCKFCLFSCFCCICGPCIFCLGCVEGFCGFSSSEEA